jgi:hypothetical protein
MITARLLTLSKKNQEELEENLQIIPSKVSQNLSIYQRRESLELCRVKQDLSGWCCVSPSFSRVFLQQEKSLYYHDEVLELSAIIDNSRCNVDLVSVKLSIEQIMNVQQAGNLITDSRIIKEEVYQVPPDKNKNPTKLTLSYDLNEISGLKMQRVFFCNGKIVDLSDEKRKLFTFSTVTVDDRFFTVDYVFHA